GKHPGNRRPPPLPCWRVVENDGKLRFEQSSGLAGFTVACVDTLPASTPAPYTGNVADMSPTCRQDVTCCRDLWLSATVGTSRAYVRGTVKDAVQGPRPRRVPVSFFGCNKLGEPVRRLPTMASSSAASFREGEEEAELPALQSIWDDDHIEKSASNSWTCGWSGDPTLLPYRSLVTSREGTPVQKGCPRRSGKLVKLTDGLGLVAGAMGHGVFLPPYFRSSSPRCNDAPTQLNTTLIQHSSSINNKVGRVKRAARSRG
ncbi:hypothetical protein THAOC_03876, partial [Thalassiosira oceanica]